jgi:hypothetical protein
LYSESDSCLDKIKKIFQNYSKPKHVLFLTVHWNRNQLAQMDKLIDNLEKLYDDEIKKAKNFILNELLQMVNQTYQFGSFTNRLVYALILINREMAEHTKVHNDIPTKVNYEEMKFNWKI